MHLFLLCFAFNIFSYYVFLSSHKYNSTFVIVKNPLSFVSNDDVFSNCVGNGLEPVESRIAVIATRHGCIYCKPIVYHTAVTPPLVPSSLPPFTSRTLHPALPPLVPSSLPPFTSLAVAPHWSHASIVHMPIGTVFAIAASILKLNNDLH